MKVQVNYLLLELAEEHDIKGADEIISQVKSVLAEWRHYSGLAGISKAVAERYEERLGQLRK